MGIQNSFPGPTGVTDQTEARKAFAGLVVRDTSGNARAGVFARHSNALVTARSDMKVDVAAFEGCTVRGGGPLFQANDGTVQVTIATAPVSNTRIDVVYFMQHESAAPYSDADDLAVLGVQAGVAVASPVLADTLALLPAGAHPLASVTIPAGKTATNQSGVVITQIFNYTTVADGKILVRTASDLAVTSGYAAMNGYRTGQLAEDMSTGITYRWSGSLWKAWSSDWITYAPTVTGVTSLGTGATVTARYQYQQGRMRINGRITLGTSPTFDNNPILTLPLTFATLVRYAQLGLERCFAFDTSAAGTPVALIARHDATNYNKFTLASWNGTAAVAISTTAPFTWAVGDTIDFDFIGDPA